MKFKCEFNGKMNQGRLVYYESGEFDFIPSRNADTIILLDYLCIGFDSKEMDARQVWGFHPRGLWIKSKLQSPIAQNGNLFIVDDIEPGDNVRLEDVGDVTYYDDSSGWICIGEVDYKDCEAVEFATNTIAVIKNSNLHALWLKPDFEKDG